MPSRGQRALRPHPVCTLGPLTYLGATHQTSPSHLVGFPIDLRSQRQCPRAAFSSSHAAISRRVTLSLLQNVVSGTDDFDAFADLTPTSPTSKSALLSSEPI